MLRVERVFGTLFDMVNMLVLTGQFQCTNGTSREGAYCVPLSSKCDSVNDCSDGSDEAKCIEEGCPGNFQVTFDRLYNCGCNFAVLLS